MDAATLEALLPDRPADLPVRIREGVGNHPHLPGQPFPAGFPDEKEPALVLYAGSFPEDAEEAAALARRIIRSADTRLDDDTNAAAALPLEKSIFEAHADFLADRPVPVGWYRLGEPLGRSLWAVDLDVFLELVLPASAWETLRGKTVPLEIQGEAFEIDIPEDASLEECWTLSECGLYEAEPGVDIEDLDEDEDLPGRFGDLHVIPLAL
jgi:hypothetical protein